MRVRVRQDEFLSWAVCPKDLHEHHTVDLTEDDLRLWDYAIAVIESMERKIEGQIPESERLVG